MVKPNQHRNESNQTIQPQCMALIPLCVNVEIMSINNSKFSKILRNQQWNVNKKVRHWNNVAVSTLIKFEKLIQNWTLIQPW